MVAMPIDPEFRVDNGNFRNVKVDKKNNNSVGYIVNL